ncbi:hypothetical protein [Actinoplanes nipponensis]|uniref:hypothetical protein n=1 Tax=Actinoplanes nipponensis TaxID=135950 RepID=UPI003671A103
MPRQRRERGLEVAVDTLTVAVWTLIAVRLALLVLPLLRRPPAAPRPVAGVGPPARVDPCPRVDPCLGEVQALPPRPAPDPEAVLYARLLAGAVSRERYRAEMAVLAARDQREHPVEPPRA